MGASCDFTDLGGSAFDKVGKVYKRADFFVLSIDFRKGRNDMID